ncbi:HAMP domain-containing histidine kinase [Gayadomonas joobiniege]|uniref:HAMP domain-containing histidine kinase n=1 Tax=Gayadomonas joobiniege TaxID=1234606 RepID=UPI000365D396|nr:HAMP domain-containing histidine kinase [Gayadomonas joobiniege]
MKNKLLWRLFFVIGCGTVALFLMIHWLSEHTETRMSFLSPQHQTQLKTYGQTAEAILETQGEQALAAYLAELQTKENTWAAVVHSELTPFAGTHMLPLFEDYFQLGRGLDWKIHLYFDFNPVMEIPFKDRHTHFLMQLPDRMRPGTYLPLFLVLVQIALPFILLSILSYILYQHLMTPLRALKKATESFSSGDLTARVSPKLPKRDDELADVALTFDKMAHRTSELIVNQRQLLADLSHELRTPLARIDMAVDFVEQNINQDMAIQRLRYESNNMRKLVEDTLTFCWLNTEAPELSQENFDLVELIEVIAEDAQFEHPKQQLTTRLPETAPIYNSSQLALGQAIENIVRNAFKYSKNQVQLELIKRSNEYQITVQDEGPGVPDALLMDIFKPFFRVDKSRANAKQNDPSEKSSGYGLGLALAQRQIHAVGGQITASNRTDAASGLKITLILPIKRSASSALGV